MAIDYGQKRVGIAVTDENRIIATGLTTVHVKDIFDFIADYISRERVDCIVVGQPLDMKSKPSDAARFIEPFVRKIKKQFPLMIVDRMDERFTSKLALQTMISGGVKKKDRQNKALIDTISATIILQSYMEYNLLKSKQ